MSEVSQTRKRRKTLSVFAVGLLAHRDFDVAGIDKCQLLIGEALCFQCFIGGEPENAGGLHHDDFRIAITTPLVESLQL